MIFDFGMYVIDIDVEKTAAYHQKDSRITCDCLGCRNFDRTVTELPPEILAFFEKLGVDPMKPEVLSIDYAPSKETMAYSGCYYLCGRMLRGENPWKQVSAGCFQLDERYSLSLGQNFFCLVLGTLPWNPGPGFSETGFGDAVFLYPPMADGTAPQLS